MRPGPSRLWLKLVLPVPRRNRIVAVGVAVADLTVGTVDDDLALLVASDLEPLSSDANPHHKR